MPHRIGLFAAEKKLHKTLLYALPSGSYKLRLTMQEIYLAYIPGLNVPCSEPLIWVIKLQTHNTYIHTYTCIHACLHTYLHTYKHTHRTHTHTHTHTPAKILNAFVINRVLTMQLSLVTDLHITYSTVLEPKRARNWHMNRYKIDVCLATVIVCYWVQLQRKIVV